MNDKKPLLQDRKCMNQIFQRCKPFLWPKHLTDDSRATKLIKNGGWCEAIYQHKDRTQPMPPINKVTRKSWMKRLQLTVSATYKQARNFPPSRKQPCVNQLIPTNQPRVRNLTPRHGVSSCAVTSSRRDHHLKYSVFVCRTALSAMEGLFGELVRVWRCVRIRNPFALQRSLRSRFWNDRSVTAAADDHWKFTQLRSMLPLIGNSELHSPCFTWDDGEELKSETYSDNFNTMPETWFARAKN